MKKIVELIDSFFLGVDFYVMKINELDKKIRSDFKNWINLNSIYIFWLGITAVLFGIMHSFFVSEYPSFVKILILSVSSFLELLVTTVAYLDYRKLNIKPAPINAITIKNMDNDLSKRPKAPINIEDEPKSYKYNEIEVSEVCTKTREAIKKRTHLLGYGGGTPIYNDFSNDEKSVIKCTLNDDDIPKRIISNEVVKTHLYSHSDIDFIETTPLLLYKNLLESFKKYKINTLDFFEKSLRDNFKYILNKTSFNEVILKHIIINTKMDVKSPSDFETNFESIILGVFEEFLTHLRKHHYDPKNILSINKQINWLSLKKENENLIFLELPISKLEILKIELTPSHNLQQEELIKEKLISYLKNHLSTKQDNIDDILLHLLNREFYKIKRKQCLIIEHPTKKIDVGRILFQLEKHGILDKGDIALIYKKNIIKGLDSQDLSNHQNDFRDSTDLYNDYIDISSIF